MIKYEDDYGISPRVYSKAYLKKDLTERLHNHIKANIEFFCVAIVININ